MAQRRDVPRRPLAEDIVALPSDRTGSTVERPGPEPPDLVVPDDASRHVIPADAAPLSMPTSLAHILDSWSGPKPASGATSRSTWTRADLVARREPARARRHRALLLQLVEHVVQPRHRVGSPRPAVRRGSPCREWSRMVLAYGCFRRRDALVEDVVDPGRSGCPPWSYCRPRRRSPPIPRCRPTCSRRQ